MDEKEKSLTQNEHVSPVGAPEGQEQAQAPSEGGSDVAAPKSLKKGHKGLIVGIIVALVLIVGGVVAWILLSQKNDGEKTGDETAVVDKDQNKDESDKSEEKPEESEDEKLARRLYAYFDGLGSRSSFYAGELKANYATEHTTRVGRIEVALQNLEAVRCKATAKNGGLVERYGENYANWSDDSIGIVSYCFDGSAAREKYKEIFGEDIDFVGTDASAQVDVSGGMDNPVEVPSPKDDKVTLNNAIFSAYSPTYDEFYAVPSGSGLMKGLHRKYVSSQRDGDNLYITEIAFMYAEETDNIKHCAVFDVIDYPTSGVILEQDFDLPDEWRNWEMEDWDEYYRSILEEMTKKVADNKTVQFKWTFKKNAEGNWIFDSLARAE